MDQGTDQGPNELLINSVHQTFKDSLKRIEDSKSRSTQDVVDSVSDAIRKLMASHEALFKLVLEMNKRSCDGPLGLALRYCPGWASLCFIGWIILQVVKMTHGEK